MRRAIVPFALVLALVTGVVLDATRLVVMTPIAAGDGDSQTSVNAAVIRLFYDAVNMTLATGDDEPLDGVLGADLVDHAARPGVAADRDGFVGSLRSLRATAPTLRLAVLDVVAQDDRVAARIRVEGGEEAAFLGLPVAAERLWSTVDVFRVETDRIVEHWGDPAGLARFEPLLSVTAPVERPTRKAVTLERRTYAPDAGETLVTDLGFLVVLVDAGTLRVAPDVRSLAAIRLVPRSRAGTAPGDQTVAPGDAATLGPGDALVIPQLARVALRNDGSVPAVVLAVGTVTPPPQPSLVAGGSLGAGPATAATWIDHTVLAGGLPADLPVGEATVAIGRAVLAPGAAFPSHQVGVAEVVAVEAGALVVTAEDGAAWVTSAPPAGTHRADAQTVLAGEGVFVEAGTAAGYRAADGAPLALVVVTFGAVPADATPEPSADGA
jgi:predicted ester cyclase